MVYEIAKFVVAATEEHALSTPPHDKLAFNDKQPAFRCAAHKGMTKKNVFKIVYAIPVASMWCEEDNQQPEYGTFDQPWR